MLINFTSASRPVVNPLFSAARLESSICFKMQFSNAARASQTVQHVPSLSAPEMERVWQQTAARYSLGQSPHRRGKGSSIVWFRNDLRVFDNEVLFKAWVSSEAVLPVYCIDPRMFGTTHYFGFPKTGLRAQFVMECLADLKLGLTKKGLNLLIRQGNPEDVLPALAKEFGAHTVYAQKETCSEEVKVERLVSRNLQKLPNDGGKLKLELIWGCSLYHIDDLPFSCQSLPDVYTQFRKSVESKAAIRSCIKLPESLGPAPNVRDWGNIPEVSALGLSPQKVEKGMAFVGGETGALSRVHEYFWKKDLLRKYKLTRNGMLGPDYSTKFSPWLASGSLSPRFIYEEIKRYEKQREANDSTYWVLFELIWRDYFRFLSIKEGNSIFHPGGPRKVRANWSQDEALFDAWRNGETGYPLIDANMKELSTTGFMSNRGRQSIFRQIVCSFLVRDMGIDWRMGAEWFETSLLDYDPCSNYGNWTYGAGVGNDSREDRYFSIPKQAQNYDPDGDFVAFWLPRLRPLPKEKRHRPGMSYLKPIVALKFANTAPQMNAGKKNGKSVP
ncbi:cryptochrome DASH, chloroplastic/mitochondrial isoform X2 [Andrographis paniculata]|uniref:cryptochrome DASH, chloroplastic/mitochondrial isoform X2 n=1 Tax=Andrographis paniculata TaxID=175694 RepID=UPI0021E9AD5D|nr:cryptochrome DASH, chloroplastic/mitochondrial isoform X2 [Andrographis paniculata]